VDDDLSELHVKFTGTNTTAPAIALGEMYFRGQEFRTVLYNLGGGNWSTNVTFSGVTLYGGTTSNATSGGVVFADFVVTDIDTLNTGAWVARSIKIGSDG
jgi:hypothetical protein